MSFELTQDNHFQFGRLEDDQNTFVVTCGSVTRPIATCFDEAVLAAQDIYKKNRTLPIKLLMSGGVDSECMAQAFLAAHVPFTVVFMRFKDNLNAFDIFSNVQFCEEKNISYEYIDLDVVDFFESGKYKAIAEKYECQSPQIATHLWLLEQVQGLPVLGGNPIAPIWKGDRWFYIGLPGELHSTYFKFFLINERPGIPWFFLYSPELIASFFLLPCMSDFVNKKVLSEADYSYQKKCAAYNEGGFSITPRQNKFTGFELLRQHYDQLDNKTYGQAFDIRFRAPLEEMFIFPETYLQFVPKNYFPENIKVE